MLLNNELIIFEEFLKDFNVKITGSQIAKKNKLNQKTVSNFLNSLEKEKILKSDIQGRNKLYFLNYNNLEIIKHFIIAIEHLKTIKFYKKNILIKEISSKISKYISGTAIIFGSYVKNLQKEDSDLDILIIGKCNEEEINKISNIYKLEINIKIYPKFKRDILINEVIKNHIIIKNSEIFVEGFLNEISYNGEIFFPKDSISGEELLKRINKW